VYDHLDRVTSVRKGSGHTTVRAYRPTDGVLESINTGGGAIQNLGFLFDGLGNLKQRTDANIAGGTETLTYDILNRLTHSTKQGAVSYQANGNILGKTGVAGETTADYTYHTTTKPHAVATAFGYTHSYDANGNLTSRTNGTTAWTLKYAGFDKPRWMAKGSIGSEFLYNANRSRTVQLEFDQMAGGMPSRYVRKRVYGLGPTLEANYEAQTPSASPTWLLKKVRIYVSGPDGMIGAREFDSTSATTAAGTEKALVYHHDHLGSIVGITPFGSTATTFAADTAGKSGRFSEDAWGQRRDPLDWTGAPTTATDDGGPDSLTPRGFTGHEMLDDLGLVHMNGRIYDPLLGRFLSADILVDGPLDLQGYNRYSYVHNNPLSLVDLNGFQSGHTKKRGGGMTTRQVAAAGYHAVTDSVTEPFTILKAGLTEKHLTPAERVQFTVFGVIATSAAVVEAGLDLVSGGASKAPKTVVRNALKEGAENVVSEVVEKEAKKLAGDAARLEGKLDDAVPDLKKVDIDAQAPGGGRKGNPETRAQNQQIGEANEAAGKGDHTGGGDLPETHFPNPAGGNKGGRFADVTNTEADGTRHVTQTVDTKANGEPTEREIDAALDIYERLVS
jgi:RHS repeat-associated protein